uniref:Uncharacterized protein n=1 Tax=Romanomermis culicivorax TaxID=13658 RepID=A0A915HPA1_ROMCU
MHVHCFGTVQQQKVAYHSHGSAHDLRSSGCTTTHPHAALSTTAHSHWSAAAHVCTRRREETKLDVTFFNAKGKREEQLNTAPFKELSCNV